MRSGALVKRVELWKKTVTIDEFGGRVESWTKHKDLKSYTMRKSGKQTEMNDEVFDLIKVRIQVRNQHDIDELDRIKYYGKMFQVDFLQPTDMQERFLTIHCTRINE